MKLLEHLRCTDRHLLILLHLLQLNLCINDSSYTQMTLASDDYQHPNCVAETLHRSELTAADKQDAATAVNVATIAADQMMKYLPFN